MTAWSEQPKAWYEDRRQLSEFLWWLNETGRISEAQEACRVVEKPYRWSFLHAQMLDEKREIELEGTA